MKQIAKSLGTVCILSLALLAARQLCAQEWSAPQKEVWKTVETYNDFDAARNLDKFMAYFHDDYLGWWNRDPLPANKVELRKFLEQEYKTTKVLVQNVKPVGIRIHDNLAFVHYHWQRIVKDSEGKEKSTRGRWTDILVKQEGKWLIIGDHGGLEYTEKE